MPIQPEQAEQAAAVWRAMLTDEEEQQLILRYLHSRPDGSAPKEELEKLTSWARSVRFEAHALDLALEGLADLVLQDNGEVAFKMTEAGGERAKQVIARLAAEQSDANR